MSEAKNVVRPFPANYARVCGVTIAYRPRPSLRVSVTALLRHFSDLEKIKPYSIASAIVLCIDSVRARQCIGILQKAWLFL